MPSTNTTIDTSNFKFIGIEGQYMLSIAVQTEKENEYINFFSSEGDLISYVDASRVGFELPVVEIEFNFSDRKLLTYLHEKAVFVISIGKDLNNQTQSTFNIVSAQIQQPSSANWQARIVGIYNAIPYLKAPAQRCAPTTSVELAKSIFQAALGSTPICDAGLRSKDQMIWFQPKQSDYRFLYDLWQHSYIPNSMWLSAIDFQGRPKIIDVRAQTKKTPEIMLTTGNADKNNKIYQILPNIEVLGDSMMSNNFGGYVQSKAVYSMDTAMTSTKTKNTAPILAEPNMPNTATGSQASAPYALDTDNTHQYYAIAPVNNKSMFMNLKAFQLDVTAEGEFLPVELLDYVIAKDVQSNGQAQQDYSGIYMVGKIAHQIANKKIYTHVTIWREAQNVMAQSTLDGQIEEAEVKINNVKNQFDEMPTLPTTSYMAKFREKQAELENKLAALQDKITNTVADSAVYKKCKELHKHLRTLQQYVNNVYAVAGAFVPLDDSLLAIQSKINDITLDSSPEQILSFVRSYTDLRGYMTMMEGKITDEINSTSVMNKWQEARSTYNDIKYKVEMLQNLGIIGDLNEHS